MGVAVSAFPDSDLTRWVQENSGRLLDEWRECCAIASVSADGPQAVTELAGWLTERAQPLFDRVEVLPTSTGAPALLGVLQGTGPRTLLLYTHYDVVPPGSGWSADPFGAEIRDGALYARGSGDDKADVMARLHALEAWRQLRGPLPFSVLWLSEGMEEVGSPGLGDLIRRHRDELRADWCLWESYYRSIDGRRAAIGFGSRGVLTVELSVRLLAADTHSGLAGVYRSATMILAKALASLTDADGRVLIPGFDDDIRELAIAPAALEPPAIPDDVDRAALWTEDREQLARRWLCEPTLNIASLHAGPAGEGPDATVLAGSARAVLDLRLMPDQDPRRIADALTTWLRDGGWPQVQVRVLNAIRPARGATDSPLAEAVRRAASELLPGGPPVEHPVVPGSGPLHLFTEHMPVEAVMPPGTIRPDSGMHGPDENVRTADYLDAVTCTLRILQLLAQDPVTDETESHP